MGKINFVSKFENGELSLCEAYAAYTEFRYSNEWYQNKEFYRMQENYFKIYIVNAYMHDHGFELADSIDDSDFSVSSSKFFFKKVKE